MTLRSAARLGLVGLAAWLLTASRASAQGFELTPEQPPPEDVEDDPRTPYFEPAPPPPSPVFPSFPGGLSVEDSDRRMLDTARAEDARQGPLQGAWDVLDANGVALFRLQLANPPGGALRLEGAWRRLVGPAGGKRVGLIEEADYNGAQAQFRFHPAGPQDLNVVTVSLGADGRWRGEYWRAGEVRDVTLARR